MPEPHRPDEEIVLKPREAASFCKVSTSYLRELPIPKLFFPSRRGRRPMVRYLKSDLMDWVRKHRKTDEVAA